MALRVRILRFGGAAAAMGLVLSGCAVGDARRPDPQPTASELQQVLTRHDDAALAQMLAPPGQDEAPAVIRATGDFRPDGQAEVFSTDDFGNPCVWLRGTNDGVSGYIVARLYWHDTDARWWQKPSGRWTVDPTYLPGTNSPKAEPCEAVPTDLRDAPELGHLSSFSGLGSL